MLIVFQSINVITCIPAFIVSQFVETYYLRVSPSLKKAKIFKNLVKISHLKPLPMEEKKLLQGFRYYAFGDEDIVQAQAELMLPERLMRNTEAYFANISNLILKLRISLLTKFNYHDLGIVALYANGDVSFRTVCFVHHSVLSYIKRGSGVKGADGFIHILIPSDDLIAFFRIIRGVFVRVFSFHQRKKKHEDLIVSPRYSHPIQETAVFFHHSISYGKLFKKLHYFSTDPNSRLHPTRVSRFVLGRTEAFDSPNSEDDVPLIDLVRTNTWRDLFTTLSFTCSRALYVRSFSELSGTIILSEIFFGYLGWRRSLLKCRKLKNVIVDYDILFPKSLALALESYGIRTIAMQERGSSSFDTPYGTIVDTFLFAGGLFTTYGERNRSNSFRKSVDFGQWRTSLFFSKNLPNYKELSFVKFSEKSINHFNSVICCLGLFTDLENLSSSPILSPSASLNFYSKVRSLAKKFPNSAVVLRLKIMSEYDKNNILKFFVSSENVFLCDDYSKMNVSYSLCQKANVIVSLFTSLAEESLAVGKKVVLIDDTHNLNNICKDIYPQDFHFAIAGGLDELISLVSKCLDDNLDLSLRYEFLKNKISGAIDFQSKNAIPTTLEKFLQ